MAIGTGGLTTILPIGKPKNPGGGVVAPTLPNVPTPIETPSNVSLERGTLTPVSYTHLTLPTILLV